MITSPSRQSQREKGDEEEDVPFPLRVHLRRMCKSFSLSAYWPEDDYKF